jgi:hypothetical protein
MKKVWNVYKRKDGFRVAVEPGSPDDSFDKNLSDEYTFLGQVTEEIEEPKKEVEKVAELYVDSDSDYDSRDYIKIFSIVPVGSHDHKLHYKIKE